MISKWLHLNELGGDPWVLPIWHSINEARKTKKIAAITKEMSELGVHISTRLNILPRIINRLNKETAALYQSAKSHKAENVFTNSESGAALSVNDDLKYQIIADIDSFLFELNSCVEQMQNFFQLLHEHAGSTIRNKDLSDAVMVTWKECGVNEAWFSLLDRGRNYFSHQGTPYLAIDISDGQQWDLLVMKENISKFDDAKQFIRYSDFQNVYQGFLKARECLQAHLIKLFK